MTYIIEQNFGKLGNQFIGYPEDTREKIVSEVCEEQHEGLVRIIELSPDGTWKDISSDIARDVAAQLIEEQEQPSWEMLCWLQNQGAAPDNMQAR